MRSDRIVQPPPLLDEHDRLRQRVATTPAFERLVRQALDSIRAPGFLNLISAERTLSEFQCETLMSMADSAAVLLDEVERAR